MSEAAAHLVDEVFPHQNIRQWVLSFPFQLRLLLAVRPKIMSLALDIAHASISRHYQRRAGLSKSKGKTGAVTLIQRFGGSLNLNVHFHMLFVDGCYELGQGKEPVGFTPAPAPSQKELSEVLAEIIKKLVRKLEKKGILTRDEEQGLQLSLDEVDGFSRLQQSSVTYRFAIGPSKGKKAMVIRTLDEDHFAKSGLVVDQAGFSLHAGVATKAHERDRLEKVCRYIARPALAEERLSLNCRGEVIYRFKKPWTDGTTAIKLTQLEFLERLVALIPRPRVNLTRYHGVLAPHYKYRKLIVPKPVQLELTKEGGSKPKRMNWARLLKRVFKVDVEICLKCGGHMKIISNIEDPTVIRKILEHLRLPSVAPRLAPARGPPLFEQPQLDLFT